MKTFLKVFAGFVLLLVIAVGIFIYMFDANNYKKELATVAESIIGRSVVISGNVNVSVYPWLGIRVNDVTINNPDGFSRAEFGSIGEFDVQVKLLPLIMNRLEIDKLVLNRMVLHFEKNAAGMNNWSDINDSSTDNEEGVLSGYSGLTLGGIELTDSAFTWSDIATAKQYKVSSLKLETAAVVEGQPLPVNLSAYIESNQPEWQSAINLKSQLEFSRDDIAFKANDMKLVVKLLLPGTQLEKLSFAMVADSEINPAAETAILTNAKISLLGMAMLGNFDVSGIFSIPTIQGPLEVKAFEAQQVAEQFKWPMPAMKNPNSLKKIAFKSDFKTDFSSFHMDNLDAQVDASSLKGYLYIENKTNPFVRFDLNVDKVVLDDYQALGGENKEEIIPLPVEFIRSTDLEGHLAINTLQFGDLVMNDFTMAANGKGGVIKVLPISMMIKDSDIKATFQLDARSKPTGLIAAKVNNVLAEASLTPLLKMMLGDDRLTVKGIMNSDVSVKFQGDSISALKKSANGSIKINMGKTVIQGIDIEHGTRSVTADYANRHDFRTSASFVPEYHPERETEFKSAVANFAIKGSRLTTKDMLLVSDSANISGLGSIDLNTERLDFRVITDMHIKSPIDIRDKLRDHPMGYVATGKFGSIDFHFDVDGYDLLVGRELVQQSKKRKIQERMNRSGNAWENVKSQ